MVFPIVAVQCPHAVDSGAIVVIKEVEFLATLPSGEGIFLLHELCVPPEVAAAHLPQRVFDAQHFGQLGVAVNASAPGAVVDLVGGSGDGDPVAGDDDNGLAGPTVLSDFPDLRVVGHHVVLVVLQGAFITEAAGSLHDDVEAGEVLPPGQLNGLEADGVAGLQAVDPAVDREFLRAGRSGCAARGGEQADKKSSEHKPVLFEVYTPK